MASARNYLGRPTVMGFFGLLVLLIGTVPVFDAARAQSNSLQRQATQRGNSPQWTPIPAVQNLSGSHFFSGHNITIRSGAGCV